MNIQHLLDLSARDHSSICPRQILGVRIGLAGVSALGLKPNHGSKRLLVITETDGCFVDGISAATNCTVGHRTLRVEDYGKVAAAFVDVETARAIRIAPRLNLREHAFACIPAAPRPYAAQMTAYQIMPDDELLNIQEVALNISIEQIVSRPGLRVNCDSCGEEIMNEREVRRHGLTLCQPCSHGGYYQPAQDNILRIQQMAIL